ncbi:putative holin-like toxin [Paenibacillus sp. FSL R7-0026]
MTTYEAIDMMLNFGIFIFALLAFIASLIFYLNAKKR